MNKTISYLIFLCALCASAVNFFGCDSKSETSIAPKLTLQLNWKPEPQFGGFYAAEMMGAFKKHGLDVAIVPGGVGTPTVQMVAAGKVPFGIASGDEIVIARANGADIVALFKVFGTNPQGIMVHAESDPQLGTVRRQKLADVFSNEGTLAIQRGLPYAAYLEKKYGFDKLKIVPSPGGDLSAFRADPNYSMQCFVTSEPIAAHKAGLKVSTFLIGASGYDPYTTVLVTRGDYLKSNRKACEKMVRACIEGWNMYLKDPGPANQTMHKLNPSMDLETFAASAKAQEPLILHATGKMSLERWQKLCDQLLDLKVIDKPVPAAECFVEVVP